MLTTLTVLAALVLLEGLHHRDVFRIEV